MTLHDVNRAQSTTQRMNSSRPRPAAIPPAMDAAPSTSSVMAETSNPAHKPKPPLPPPPPQQAGMPTVLLTVYVQTLLKILTVQDAVRVLAVAAGYSTVMDRGGNPSRALHP